jgi:two-component system, NarL family, nitrate/nitrite response regulator NarL
MTATSSFLPPATRDRSAVRVGIVDDHALISETLALLLSEKGFVAHGLQPADIADVATFAAEHELNVILLDLNLQELGTSVPIIPQLRELGCRVIILTGDTARPVWGACIEAGAETVISKAVSFTQLLERVTDLLDDVAERPRTEAYELLECLREYREEERQRLAPFAQLTVREHEVLLALTLGMSADDIASSMYVSIATVRTHIRSILLKLGVSSQLAAVTLAIRAGWDKAPNASHA